MKNPLIVSNFPLYIKSKFEAYQLIDPLKWNEIFEGKWSFEFSDTDGYSVIDDKNQSLVSFRYRFQNYETVESILYQYNGIAVIYYPPRKMRIDDEKVIFTIPDLIEDNWLVSLLDFSLMLKLLPIIEATSTNEHQIVFT